MFGFGLEALLGVVVLCGLLSYGFAIGFMSLMRRVSQGQGAATPVAPFFGAITAIFALTFGFVAADVWGTDGKAREARTFEGLTFSRLVDTAAAMNLPQVTEALALYRDGIAAEWGEGANLAPDASVEAALRALRRALVAADAAGASPVLLEKLITDFDQLQDNRATRLAIGARDLDALKWGLLIFLGVMSQLALAACHNDRGRGGDVSIALFTMAATAAICLLMLYAEPYRGWATLAPPEVLRAP